MAEFDEFVSSFKQNGSAQRGLITEVNFFFWILPAFSKMCGIHVLVDEHGLQFFESEIEEGEKERTIRGEGIKERKFMFKQKLHWIQTEEFL